MIGGTPFVPTPSARPRRGGWVKGDRLRARGADMLVSVASAWPPPAASGLAAKRTLDASEHRGTQKT